MRKSVKKGDKPVKHVVRNEPPSVSFRGPFVQRQIAKYEAAQKKKERASTDIVRGARAALAERVLEAVDKKTAKTNKKFFDKLPPSAAQKSKEALVKSAEEKGKDFDKIANRDKK